MKQFLISLSLLLVTTVLVAQPKLPPVDSSPLDISFYPVNYPLAKIQEKVTEPLVARVIYSRPQKNKRKIFGELIEYGKVWRLGANEATEIEFFQNVKINQVKLKKGRYTMYAIPYPEKWTIILNKELETWGSFRYDEKKDLVRFDVPVSRQTEIAEVFTLIFEKPADTIQLNAYWDDVKVSIPVSLQ